VDRAERITDGRYRIPSTSSPVAVSAHRILKTCTDMRTICKHVAARSRRAEKKRGVKAPRNQSFSFLLLPSTNTRQGVGRVGPVSTRTT